MSETIRKVDNVECPTSTQEETKTTPIEKDMLSRCKCSSPYKSVEEFFRENIPNVISKTLTQENEVECVSGGEDYNVIEKPVEQKTKEDVDKSPNENESVRENSGKKDLEESTEKDACFLVMTNGKPTFYVDNIKKAREEMLEIAKTLSRFHSDYRVRLKNVTPSRIDVIGSYCNYLISYDHILEWVEFVKIPKIGSEELVDYTSYLPTYFD